MDRTEEQQKELDTLGRGIKIYLDAQFSQWGTGLPFKVVFPKYGVKIKSLGLGMEEFVDELRKAGYVKLVQSPTGKRMFFSGDCPLTESEMTAIQQDAEHTAREEKLLAKQNG